MRDRAHVHLTHRSHASRHGQLEWLVLDVALGDECGHLLRDRVAPQRGSRDLVRVRVRLGLGLGLL